MENQPQSKPSINWKTVITVVIVLVVVLGILGGGWYYLASRETITQPTTTTPTKQASPSAKKDETAGWKTYTSKLKVFEVKHPDTVVVDTEASVVGTFDGKPTETLRLEVRGEASSKEKDRSKLEILVGGFLGFCEGGPPEPVCTLEGTTISGVKTDRYTYTKAHLVSEYSNQVYLIKGKNITIVEYSLNKTTKELFDQILSTFKFL